MTTVNLVSNQIKRHPSFNSKENLSKAVYERRKWAILVFLGGGFAQMFGYTVSVSVKTLQAMLHRTIRNYNF